MDCRGLVFNIVVYVYMLDINLYKLFFSFIGIRRWRLLLNRKLILVFLLLIVDLLLV